MKTLADDLSERQLNRVEIPEPDRQDELGLSGAGELGELAAREAACCLVYYWDSQFEGIDPRIVTGDINLAIEHLKRWRDNLIEHGKRPDLA